MNDTRITNMIRPAPEGGRLRVLRYRDVRDIHPRLHEGAWSDVVETLSRHTFTPCAPCPGKDCTHKFGEALSFVEFFPGRPRGGASVHRIYVLTFDVDHGDGERVKRSLATMRAAGLDLVCSSTHSHTPDRPRVRKAIRLSRPISVTEHARLWPFVDQRFDVGADPQAKDAARLFFLPTAPAGTRPFVFVNVGSPLDVDAMLAEAPPLPSTPSRPRLTGAEWIGLLDQLGEGNRDSGLTRLAGTLFRELSEPRLAELLLHAANARFCRPPLDDHQVAKIAGSIARREARSFSGGQP
ncbi:MAG: primase alpha helix C-terminal domain-containing protein [Myxococcota bacterium]